MLQGGESEGEEGGVLKKEAMDDGGWSFGRLGLMMAVIVWTRVDGLLTCVFLNDLRRSVGLLALGKA